jgi:CRP-like cAMP-binding protein
MEAIGPGPSDQSPRWVSRLAAVLQPLVLRADRLGSMRLFEGFRWPELQEIAAMFEDVEVGRGTRMTVQGRPDARLWLIFEGEALVSADARPLRVIGPGEAAGVTGMLLSVASPETTIALAAVRALAAGPEAFRELAVDPRIRLRLTALAGDQGRSRRLARVR